MDCKETAPGRSLAFGEDRRQDSVRPAIPTAVRYPTRRAFADALLPPDRCRTPSQTLMSAFGTKRDVQAALMDVRFHGNSGHDADVARCLLMTHATRNRRFLSARKSFHSIVPAPRQHVATGYQFKPWKRRVGRRGNQAFRQRCQRLRRSLRSQPSQGRPKMLLARSALRFQRHRSWRRGSRVKPGTAATLLKL